MSTLRVLYVASEIAPFLETSSVSIFVGKLAAAIQGKNIDIRILVPRFGVINERRNSLHEVVRLSGIGIKVGLETQYLTVKVTTIPTTRIQVYFIDNPFYFQRKFVFKDKENNFFSDNDERLIFICKGALATVKNLNWVPNIVHCHDWITSLIPFYLKQDVFFQQTKVLFNIYDTGFDHFFKDDFLEKAELADIDGILSDKGIGFMDLMYIGTKYADVITQSESFETEALSNRLHGKTIHHITYDAEGLALYHKIYKQLLIP